MNTSAFVRHLFDDIRARFPDKSVFDVVEDVEKLVERLVKAAEAAPQAAAVAQTDTVG
ncbi:hypothetical protein MKK84_18755 [Methylobacterium sp. E-065]|uniref:hypothetical protein n=1 Tax=Methylobacterium sp. E-065 TaxID=2836583 RepID=UPI001FB8DF93|nr:hypothetical protein [Methylobacterium sp. E-065]MCJ2019452.1 hypothetical protein [Methylobacterium sp. E-065]